MRAHVREGYVASSDLLTRAGPASDFATDTCIRRAGIDPATDVRYLEELAFEVVNEQSEREVRERAEDLSARGVRRIIAIFVERGEVREWSPDREEWVTLARSSLLEDPVLIRPVPVRALLDTAAADDAVVDALDAKGNRRLDRLESAAQRAGRRSGLRESREEGREEGRREAVEVACELLGISLGPDERRQLEQLDGARLEALLAHLKSARRWPA